MKTIKHKIELKKSMKIILVVLNVDILGKKIGINIIQNENTNFRLLKFM